MSVETTVQQEFITRFGAEPTFIVRGPGRVNLIGEHTDYNDGFVLPMAIERAIWIALQPRDDQQVILDSLDFKQRIQFSLDQFTKSEQHSPAEYVKAMTWAMQEAGFELRGWEGVMAGDIPIGAGLSSSAALEMAIAQAHCAISDISWNAPQMAKLAQKGDNQWIGIQSGVMDQMISASGKAGNALLIDCRSLECEFAPLPEGTTIVVLDTRTNRELVDSAYNERRAQCESAAEFFGVPALRDVTLEQFQSKEHDLPEIMRKRARHVISENQRTLDAFQVMQSNDARTLGRLMNESHNSLRDDYEVSSKELNIIVECAQEHPASLGARMTGAGFGGCAIALVKSDSVDEFVEHVKTCYHERAGIEAQIYVSSPANGAEIVSGRKTEREE